MSDDHIIIKQHDNYRTVLYPHYTTQPVCLGSVVVLHGVAEHHARYDEFADFLNAGGYDVFLYDHRGHGTDKKREELGHFADSNGYKKVISDAIKVLHYVKKENRGSKLVLFAHSMGSLIGRNAIQYFDGMDCAVFCGTANNSAFISRCGLLIASLVKCFKGARHVSPYLSQLCTGGKKYDRLSSRTAYDWLTRSNTSVGQYINDPCCGFTCTAALYKDLIKLNYLAGMQKLIKKTRRDLPILFIAGSSDPVGNYAKDVTKLFSLFQKLGFTNAECTIYSECRHELLNELNKKEIMTDVLTWINNVRLNASSSAVHNENVIPSDSAHEPDEEEVLSQIRSSYDALLHPEETEGEKRLAAIRAEKQARNKNRQ